MTAVLLHSPCSAQSGYQVINGTRVFTSVDQQGGVATFSNDCGSQTLTQHQLQQGAIPTDIIPCPRPGQGSSSSSPPPQSIDSRRICPNGQRCNDGSLCQANNTCLVFSSPRYCGGRSSCPEGEACADNNTHCVSTNDPRYCGGRSYCPQGQACVDNNSHCVSTSDPRYCGGRSYCPQGQACVDNNTHCIADNDPRYCGDRRYCEPGSVCLPGDKCGPPGNQAGDGVLSSSDCKCISVLPIVPGVKYRVTNSCGAMFVAVLFTGDILHLSPSVNALSSWARLGQVAANGEAMAQAPDGWTIVSIGAVALRNKVSSFTCDFVNGAPPE